MPDPEHSHDGDETALATELLDIVNSSWKSQAICVAARLGIADLLRDGPLPAEDIAAASRCDAPSLLRLMRALASLGVVRQHDNGAFALAPLGMPLCSNARHSVRSWAVWWGRYSWPVWGNLHARIRTGRKPAAPLSKAGLFEHMERDPEMAATFNGAMAEMSRLIADALIRHHDFSDIRHVVDVGGGHGELLSAILAAYPGIRGTLFDLPHVVDAARQYIKLSGLESRCDFLAGSFLEQMPEAADAYLLKSILHDWDDAHCARILDNCRRAVPEHGRLLLIEYIAAESPAVTPGDQNIARSDLNMLLALGGKERTQGEFDTLLSAHGFSLTKITPVGMNRSLIEAIPCRDNGIP